MIGYKCKLCGESGEVENFPSITLKSGDVISYCFNNDCFGSGDDLEEIQIEVNTPTKAERIRTDILDFIEAMRFKHSITYHAIQVGYVDENEQSKMTGLIDGSNSFLKNAAHQIELITNERN